MYFTLSPFFYYLANCNLIQDFITIELGGSPLAFEQEYLVKKIIKKYVINNSHGVDAENIDKYVEYIYKHLTF